MPRNYEAIVERYVERIVDGDLAPGDRLPREQDLALEFGLSRGVAREAIRALQERGLVRVTHGRGQFVSDREDWRVLDPDVLRAMLTAADARDLLKELLECRLVCEVDAAGLAARRANAQDRQRLGERFNALVRREAGERPAATAAAHAAERAFHEAILIAAHNRPLAQMVRPVLAALEQAGAQLPPRAASIDERRKILFAIIEHDAVGASAAMASHLRAVQRSLRRAA
jgi:GntR family transcriptional repressor for pyruvate dehydrogenase complex